jgi:hypothetical protein
LDFSNQLRVGWREWLSLPELGIPAIKAKVDTGARTSCIHASQIRLVQRDGQTWVDFLCAPLREHSSFTVHCQAPLADERQVSDSGGHKSLRPFVSTRLEIGGQSWPIEVSLADRRRMKLPMLLGRTAMQGRIAVYPGESYLTGRKQPHIYRAEQGAKPSRGIT